MPGIGDVTCKCNMVELFEYGEFEIPDKALFKEHISDNPTDDIEVEKDVIGYLQEIFGPLIQGQMNDFEISVDALDTKLKGDLNINLGVNGVSVKVDIDDIFVNYEGNNAYIKLNENKYKVDINKFKQYLGDLTNTSSSNNAIDLDKFKYNKSIREKKRKELKISDDTIVIGHIGRFVKQKNHDFLIDIFNEIHKCNKESILLLAGQGPLQEEIKNKVKQLNIDKNVYFLGQRSDVNELYQVFDVFLLPSLYEGLPVVGVEAQATGNLCFLSDAMTKETKVLDSTRFVSLKKSAEEWANEILNCLKEYKKHDTTREVSKYGFNIKVEVKKMEDKYIELYKKIGGRKWDIYQYTILLE